jgi:hypothetical protein
MALGDAVSAALFVQPVINSDRRRVLVMSER